MSVMLHIIIFFLGFMLAVAIISFVEKKIKHQLQNQRSQNSFLQPFFDVLKFICKQNALSPPLLNIFFIILFLASSFVLLSLIPLSDKIFITNFPHGIVYIVFFYFLLCFCEIMASAKSQHGNIKVERIGMKFFTMILPFVLVLNWASMKYHSLNLVDIVHQQKDNFDFRLMPLFIVFCITCLIGENRKPFCFASSLKDGYGGILFLMISLAEWLRLVFSLMLISTIFLGGDNPIMKIESMPQCFWLFVKSIFVFIFMILLSTSLPKYRLDQIVKISLLLLCPIAILYSLSMF